MENSMRHTEQFREHVRDIMIHHDVLRATYTDFLLAKASRQGVIKLSAVLRSGSVMDGRRPPLNRLLEALYTFTLTDIKQLTYDVSGSSGTSKAKPAHTLVQKA